MKSREAAKKETRAALIRAGVALYMAGEGDQPSLDAICAHAGFTRGAFYVHFKDRTEFLQAVIDDVLRRFVDSVIVDEGLANVSETVGRFIDAVRDEGPLPRSGSLGFLVRALFRYPKLRERYGAVLATTLQRLAGIISNDQAAGVVRRDVPAKDISTILVTAAVGIASLAHTDVQLDLSELRDTANRLLDLS